ncbi:MAG: Si-specific NAD(P)(+) transhydrogenase [Gammaproteobacteria bacterium]|nr:Si-specific NAD(P)(+) transhydrogenase [Gammaproteobacteria bacterium]
MSSGNTYDLIVLGTGPAGEKAAAKAAYFGKKVAIIEKEKCFGGAGVNTGTVPSKTLKESALYYSGKYDKGIYGHDRAIDGQTTIQDFLYRKNHVIEALDEEVKINLERHQVDIFHGTASFEDANTICIAGEDGSSKITSDYIIIATGSYPFQPSNINFDGVIIHDSDTILNIMRIPDSLCIVGAGVIGCEYATIFAAMDCKVYLVNSSDRILPFLDNDISQALVTQMHEDGVEILFNTQIEEMLEPENIEDDIHIRLNDGTEFDVDMFLFAAGRSGTTSELDCDKAGVALGKREAVEVNDQYQTSQENIYAVGDVIGFPALASTSMDQGRVAVSHIFEIHDLDVLPKVFPYGIYTIPEVSMVGITQEQAQESDMDYIVGRAHHANIPRGRIMGAKTGVLKIIISKDDMVIRGVHIMGRMASEIIHYGLAIVQYEKTVNDVVSTVFNYPTLHDLYKFACYDALGNLSGHKLRGF